MGGYLQPLIDNMRAAADPQKAEAMTAYMRDLYPFLGIKSPERRAILKEFLAEYGLPHVEELPRVSQALWQQPEREHQYNATDILRRRQKKLTPDFVPTLEWLITNKAWWDTVDILATNVAGTIFATYRDTRDAMVAQWRADEDIWLRRTALLFQLKYKDRTDVPLLFSLIEENLDNNEFFIQKAIGWALREYSKTDATAVRDFVARSDLSPFAEREALKWLKRQEQREP